MISLYQNMFKNFKVSCCGSSLCYKAVIANSSQRVLESSTPKGPICSIFGDEFTLATSFESSDPTQVAKCVVATPDMNMILIGMPSLSCVKIMSKDPQTGIWSEAISPLTGQDSEDLFFGQSIAVSSTTEQVAIASFNYVFMYRYADGILTFVNKFPYVCQTDSTSTSDRSLSFSPDGKYLIMGQPGLVTVITDPQNTIVIEPSRVQMITFLDKSTPLISTGVDRYTVAFTETMDSLAYILLKSYSYSDATVEMSTCRVSDGTTSTTLSVAALDISPSGENAVISTLDPSSSRFPMIYLTKLSKTITSIQMHKAVGTCITALDDGTCVISHPLSGGTSAIRILADRNIVEYNVSNPIADRGLVGQGNVHLYIHSKLFISVDSTTTAIYEAIIPKIMDSSLRKIKKSKKSSKK